MGASTTVASTGTAALEHRARDEGRPTTPLPWTQLITISVYWFGISAIWGGYEQFGQKQYELMAGAASKGTLGGIVELLGSLVALLVQPTMGVISDYTSSRWGRRKAYILVGAAFDLIFLTGLALIAIPEPAQGTWDKQGLGSGAGIVLYVACYLLLQLSSNFAQGPFQGYVPDLVPEGQVGAASGAMGVMRQAGLMFGAVVVAVGSIVHQWGVALIVVGVLELTLAVLTFRYVREGRAAKSPGGRSWLAIGREAWGTDVLRERAFLAMSAVRYLFLMATGIFANVSLYFLQDSMGITNESERGTWMIAGPAIILAAAICSSAPAARISNGIGRRPVVWGAIAIAAVGVSLTAVAPSPVLAIPGLVTLGIGVGAYLAVDWALMTELIPLASSGRYMGLANIANSVAGPSGLLIGGIVMDAITRSGAPDVGPRAAIMVGVPLLVAASVALLWVHPKRGRDAVGRALPAPAG